MATAARVTPSPRGKMLVDAWNCDDAERYQKLLNTKFPDIPLPNHSDLDGGEEES